MVMMKLAALAADDPFPTFAKLALDAKTVEPWVGLYKVKDERRVFVRDGRLYRSAPAAASWRPSPLAAAAISTRTA